MSKVELNYSAIEGNGLTQLDSAIASLGQVITYLQQTSIPGDFYRRTTLSNTIDDLKVRKNNLVDLKNWIINSNKNYNSMIDKLERQAYQLPTYQIKRRSNIV